MSTSIETTSEIDEELIAQATRFFTNHPHLIPNELIFKGLSRLVTREANGASVFSKSELDEYFAEHPEENFLLRISLGAYALTHGLLLIEDIQFSKSVREGREAQKLARNRSWLSRVSRAILNLDKQETTTLIREHQRLAGEVMALEKTKLDIECKISELNKESGTILDKAQTRSETLLRETRDSIERMQKDSLAHIKSIHEEKFREIKQLEVKLEEMNEEIAMKQVLVSELSQNPDIVKEWEARRVPQPKPNTTALKIAKEIMGVHFIEPEEAERYLKFQFTAEEREKLQLIPWSEDELEELKSTYFLVPGYPLNILDIRARAPENTFYTYKDAWYNGHNFATQEKVELRWYLIRKTIVPESTGESYGEQLTLLSGQDENPRACEQAHAMVLYYLVRGQELFSEKYARCRCFSSGGNRVYVDFYDGRLHVPYWSDDLRRNFLGLASSRKFRS